MAPVLHFLAQPLAIDRCRSAHLARSSACHQNDHTKRGPSVMPTQHLLKAPRRALSPRRDAMCLRHACARPGIRQCRCAHRTTTFSPSGPWCCASTGLRAMCVGCFKEVGGLCRSLFLCRAGLGTFAVAPPTHFQACTHVTNHLHTGDMALARRASKTNA